MRESMWCRHTSMTAVEADGQGGVDRLDVHQSDAAAPVAAEVTARLLAFLMHGLHGGHVSFNAIWHLH